MTIEVIDRTPHPDVLKKVICKNCGVTLQYLPIDTVVGWKSAGGDRWTVDYIVCPECKSQVVTKDNG